MITSIAQHDVFLVYPVLALLSNDALGWLPPSPISATIEKDEKVAKSLKSHSRSASPCYDAFHARTSGRKVR